MVEDIVILELKSIERITPIHEAQLLTYMKLLNRPVGFIINFNVPVLRSGIVRKVLQFFLCVSVPPCEYAFWWQI